MPAFRAKQLFSWIHKGADFDEMHNLPKELRAQLQACAIAQPVRIIGKRTSSLDGTVKFGSEIVGGRCDEMMQYGELMYTRQ